MLLIQKFAELCRSTTQTLRYYDKVGILKPFYIEKSSKYRYYREEQVFDFFKIKQLQDAGFSLEEIKSIKDKDDDVIIEALNDKCNQLKERVNRIETLMETYLNEKMKLKSKVEELVYERLNVITGVNQLMMVTQNDQVKLKCKKQPEPIANLLNEMQAQIIIGLDDISDFKKYEKAEWDYSMIYKDWQNVDELLADFKPIPDDYSFGIHLFNVNETITLFDIDKIICASNDEDMKDKDILFNVSLSEDHQNTYAILYSKS